MNIMWIDDDSPTTERQIGEVRVQTAQSLSEAEQRLGDPSKPALDWVVLDLIVPQAGWREDYLMVPGLAYLNHLSELHRERPRVAVYSIALTPDRTEHAENAGAELVLDKQLFSFSDVIEKIRQYESDDKRTQT